MSKMIGRNQNTSDAAVITTAVIDAITTTTILAANPKRIAFYVTNNNATDPVWIKLQAASVDNDKKGIILGKKAEPPKHWDMPSDNIYTGEISAIADSGTPTIYVTEY